MRARHPSFVSFLIAVALVVVACSGGAGAGATAPTISDAWIRPPMGPGSPAAGYLTITGGDAADALVGASTPIATDTQIHETTAGTDGMAGMQEVDRIDVAAGATVTFEPGGYHIMFMDPDAAMLEVGGTVELTLTFETAGDVTVEAEVKAG